MKRSPKPKAPPYAENEGLRVSDNSPVDVTGWLTVNQAIDLLGCSRNTLERWVRDGHLHGARARRDPNSLRWHLVYDPVELAKLPRKYRGRIPDEAGELAARCFELFDEGASNRRAVLELRQTPEKIAHLREEWLDGGGSQLVISPAVKAELAELIGDFESVADLVSRLRAKIPANEAETP